MRRHQGRDREQYRRRRVDRALDRIKEQQQAARDDPARDQDTGRDDGPRVVHR
jgi:hypothetical protein